MPKWFFWSVVLTSAVLALAAAGGAQAAPVVFTAAGATPASIQAQVDAFRNALGNPNNGNAPGPLPSGRREINWDGGGDATTPAGTPFTAFQNIRGATFTTPGSGFVQAPPSGGPQGGLATFFMNPTYGTIFTTFSAPRLFTPVGSNITDTTFSIPGSGGATPATVSGFGAVFTDVDLAGVTTIQYFAPSGASLGTFSAPVANNGLSFLGVFFNAGERVAQVRITTGNSALGPNDNPPGVDVVVMDDFLYSEPMEIGLAVPEPASMTLALLGASVAGLGILRRRRAPRPAEVV